MPKMIEQKIAEQQAEIERLRYENEQIRRGNYQTNPTLKPIGWLERWLVYHNDDDLIRLSGDDPF